MSRSWPYLTAVAVVGVLAGAAIGGKPVAQDPFVLSPGQVPTTTIISASTTAPSFATTTTVGERMTTTTTIVSDTSSATDTTGVTDTTGATTRIVIADATGTSTALVTAQATLTTAGYTQIASSVVAVGEASTTVYYRPGFAAQADAVAQLLGADQATLVPLVDQVVSTVDAQGDVVVLLGSDVAA